MGVKLNKITGNFLKLILKKKFKDADIIPKHFQTDH